ncbi:ABC transporter substrate-binding protein [Prochlorothrix hollandica]|uniref:ABC transporter substrate-binding protein n=1 Tax=Prochlorothrix hollandica TaxID=1223 RepID=UPI00333E42A6
MGFGSQMFRLSRSFPSLTQGHSIPGFCIVLGLISSACSPAPPLTLFSSPPDPDPSGPAVQTGGSAPPSLQLLTWEGYAPPALVRAFEQETGIRVNITYVSSTADLQAQLDSADRPYDLVTPLASDLLWGAEPDQSLASRYQPWDLDRITNRAGLNPVLVTQAQQLTQSPQPGIATLGADTPAPQTPPAQPPNAPKTPAPYGLPAAWGTLGLVVNTATVDRPIRSYRDLCDRALPQQVSLPRQFPSLMVAAYAQGLNPFQALQQVPPDPLVWGKLLAESDRYLRRCQGNLAPPWQNAEDIIDLMYDRRASVSLAWDSTGWLLHQLDPAFEFVVPQEGALGWMTVFALPLGATQPDAAYAWLNFLYQADRAAAFTLASGFSSPVLAALDDLPPAQQTLLKATYSPAQIAQIHWLPPHPTVLNPVTATYTRRLENRP